jgi:hypothetical protein
MMVRRLIDLAALTAILASLVCSIFWLRSRFRDDYVEILTMRGGCVLGSSDSRLRIVIDSRTVPQFIHVYQPHSIQLSDEVEEPWQYMYVGGSFDKIGHVPFYDFVGVRWRRGGINKIVFVPYSYIVTVSIGFAGWWGWQIKRRRTRLRRERAGLCPTCSYDLRAHAPGSACPECGTPIPASPSKLATPPAANPNS